MIIDPGPQLVDCAERRQASLSRDSDNLYAPTFPPPLNPHGIDTLGDLKTDDVGRLLVLGGHGHSGSFKTDTFGQPRIDHYANNDGWFDDTSDGPVMARLVMYAHDVERMRFIDVEYPAWVVVGYPAYVPEILDMVTMEEVLTDLAVRQFAACPELYGEAGTFDNPPSINPTDTEALVYWRAGRLTWNAAYKPWFYRDIWPILFRPGEFSYLCDVLKESNAPHDQTARGTFDPDRLSVPRVINRRALAACQAECIANNDSGELMLASMDAVLTQLDSEANSTLHRGLDRSSSRDSATTC